ncbi:uncharacterized protein LOC106693171 [Microplitis demolitor]|uniref:uncharacterized protein LOC106693171 n=1 Tax=Microplitis demolitor TaxID=69319 RepID=UPI0006D522BE|nr:uncharacterized protein LOC106693171 [Microplitis demolitor]
MSIEPRTERILVKPHNTSTTTNTILTIKENIDIINLGVNVKNVASKSNGNVIIDVENQADKIKLTSEIHNKLGNTFEVKNINQRYPMVKIVGLEENALQINQQKLINDLVLQNEWSNLKDNSTQCLIKMIKKYKTKNGFSTGFYAKKLLDEMKYIGFEQKVNTATRTTFNSETIIDLVFTNFELTSEVLDKPKIADHNNISIKLTNVVDTKKYSIRVRDYSKFDDKLFQMEVKNKLNNFNLILLSNNNTDDETDYNNAVAITSNNIVNIINEMAPVQEKLIKYRWNKKPWIDINILNLIKERNRAFKKAKITKNINDIESYKMLRNNVVRQMKNNKFNFYKKEIDGNKHNSKKMWKTLKQLTGDKRCSYSIINEIKFGDKIVTDHKDIANKLNEKNSNEINGRIRIGTDCLKNDVNVWDKFDQVQYETVDKLIKNLDCKKGRNNDINADILKLIWSVVPNEWKVSTIIPIQKIKGTIKAEELRPIKTLPVLEQVLEKLV